MAKISGDKKKIWKDKSSHLSFHEQMMTDQIGVVCPLEILLHRAIIQSNPGVIMTQTFN